MNDTFDLRPTLGDFSSIVCFRALVVGMEETLGFRAAMVALKSAGRKRGHDLIASLGLTGAAPAPDAIADALHAALGPEGTRLCNIRKVEQDDDGMRVYLTETVCSADEPMGSERQLSFTLGAIHGAMEALYEAKYRAKQVGSVLRGQDFDIVEIVPR